MVVRLVNNSSAVSTFSISESGAAGALDESVFSPSLPGKSRLGECPCEVTVAANSSATFGLRVEVGDVTPGWYTSRVRVHRLHTGGRLLASFQVKIDEVGADWDVTVSRGSLSLAEADDPDSAGAWEHQAAYSVRLTEEPSGDVTVTPVSADASVVAVSGALTFTAADWQTPKTVTVTAVDDDIANVGDRHASIRHDVSGVGVGDVTADDVAVVVADDDIRGVSVSAGTLALDEADDPDTGGVLEHRGAYTVRLTSEPAGGDVTVGLASGDTSVATVTPATLKFTSADWGIPQTVTVTAVDDSTDTASGRQTSIAHTVTSTGDYAGMTAADVAVTVGPLRIDPCTTDTGGDYDIDDDGLIEICNLAQLNAIRWDLNGDGAADVYPPDKDGVTGHDPDGTTKHAAAFPNAITNMGCPTGGCAGYELSADLDFDTNANGRADTGDDYWNNGLGWHPLIGGAKINSARERYRFWHHAVAGGIVECCGYFPNPRARMFTAEFEGNGRTIANLYINDPVLDYVGLFGIIGHGAHVRNFGLTAPNADSKVVGGARVGALAGDIERGRVSGVYSDIDVSGERKVGGLAGSIWRFGFMIESYATGDVTGKSIAGGLLGVLSWSGVAAVYATGDVTVEVDEGGGLAGYRADGHLRAAYATGSVSYTGAHSSPGRRIGGLVGGYAHWWTKSWMRANYATGRVSSPNAEITSGGLTGGCKLSKRERSEGANYWDVEATGMATSPDCGMGYTTAQLQAPTGYTGIYADWNVDVNVGSYHGSFLGPGDDPWDFGTSTQYPVLKYCAEKPGIETPDGQPYCPLQPGNQRDPSSGQVETDSSPVVNVAAATDISEGQSAAFIIAANPNPSADLPVNISVTAGGDYGVTVETTTVTIPADGSYTLSVATTDDNVDEDDGTVTVTIDTGTGYTVSATAGTATVAVADDDVAPCDTADAISRARAAFAWHVDNNGGNEALFWQILAYLGADPMPAPPGGTVPASTTPEAVRTFSGGKSWPGWVQINAAMQCHTPPPVVSIAAGADVDEGDVAVFTVSAVPAPSAALDVSVAVTETGDFGVSPGSRIVTIPASGTATLTVATANDSVDEPDGSVTATVGAGTGYTVSATAGAASVAVADDDVPPPSVCVPSLPWDAVTVAVVTGWRGELSHAAHQQRWDRVLAALGVDTGETAMTVADAQAVKARIDNSRWDRTVRTLEAMAQCGTDPPPAPAVDPEVSIAAGGGITEGGDAAFTVTADPAPTAALTVEVTVAQAGDFGVTTGSQSVTVPTGGSVTLTVATANDTADEPDGSVTATVGAGSGYTISAAAGTATVAVADDDDPPPPVAVPEVSITAGGGVTEGGDAVFTVTAVPAPSAALTVEVTVSQSGDFGVSSGSRTVTVPTTGSVTLTVATTGDSADELDGSVTVTIGAGSGYTVSQLAGTASVGVADDDDPPPPPPPVVNAVPSLSISDASAGEGGTLTFTVTLSPASDRYVWVHYYARPGHGAAFSATFTDFAQAYGMLTFRPGETTKTVTVAAVDDSRTEDDETFTVVLYSAVQAAVADGEGVGTITDND
ncbi:Calx-beta domain-containing protein [Candidatus Poriferisodalis sp.]|uniref:Calx-beta domain-containing protein n=1 Tax=Candidatus Poriferisodalis sp. TaxID=3101277 RepID=UPI003B5B6829